MCVYACTICTYMYVLIESSKCLLGRVENFLARIVSIMYFILHLIRRCKKLGCCTVSEAKIDHLVKVVITKYFCK